MQNKCKKLKDKILRTFVTDIRESSFYQVDFKSAFDGCLKELEERRIGSLICYGLGSFQEGVEIASRYQLGLLILMHEYLRIQGHPVSPCVELYDPSFEQLDKEVLLSLSDPSFKLIDENEHCARRIEAKDDNACTLIYMPHLDKYLYNNLLGANWITDSLERIVILGNSFNEMIDNETISKRKNDLHYMNQLVTNFNTYIDKSSDRKKKKRPEYELSSTDKALAEFAIDDRSFKHADIFNSLAFHVIKKSWLKRNSDRISQSVLANWSYVTSDLAETWVD